MVRRICKTSLWLFGTGWFLVVLSPVWGAHWPVKKVKLEKREPVAEPRFKSAVSAKNLLKLSRPNPGALPYARPTTAAAVETLKILALRVEFQKEVPDDPTTTGLGVFDRRTQQEFLAQEGHLVDPAPHDKKYFESHIQALDRYWQAVSNGRLKWIGEVWPPADDSTYQLPYPLAFYGSPNRDSVIFQISKFFKDAVRLADSVSPELDFSAYQALAIFHAGSSRQDDIFGDTPNDFFTGLLRLGDSVVVDSGRSVITEGTILPESPSQDNRPVGLNGTFAHEFGHQLGLVDLYNTETLITQVGDFSLMDNNGADVAVELDFRPIGGRLVLASQLLPVYPDAWSRAFLGFVDSMVVTRGPATASLLAAELQSKSVDMVKIPVSEQEYFLVENRATDLDSYSGSALKVDPVTSVVLGPGRPVTPDSSVFTGEYDILLPGSGILIWHVDEAVALEPGCADDLGNLYSRFVCNTPNNNPARRFVELEEADGFVDFGGNYYTGAFGFAEDMYWAPNNTAFTPSSNPSSRSKFGGQTGISVTGIGGADTVMSFSVSSDYLLPSWPQFTGRSPAKDFPAVGDLDGNGMEEILTLSGLMLLADDQDSVLGFLPPGASILAWKQDGSNFLGSNLFRGKRLGLNGDTSSFPVAMFALNPDAGDSFSRAPIGFDIDKNGSMEVFAGSTAGAVWGFKADDFNSDGLADSVLGFPRKLRNGSITSLLIGKIDTFANPMIFAGTSSGKGFLVSSAGIPRDSAQFKGAVIGAALDSSGNLFVTTDRNDSVFVYKGIDLITGWPKGFAADSISAPVLAQGDSGVLIAFVTGGDELYLLDGNGNKVAGFPVNLGSTKLPQPVWSHSSATGQPVIVLAYDNQIVAYQTNGLMATDFPKSVDRQRPINGDVPLLTNLSLRENGMDMLCALPWGNLYFPNTLEREAAFVLGTGAGMDALPAVTKNGKIFARDVSGFVYGYGVPGFGFDSLAWRQARHNFSGSNFMPNVLLPGTGSGDLVAGKSFYNYPNPVLGGTTALRYRLNSPGTATLSVYDMAGNRIKEPQSVPAEAGNDNEVQLDCSGFAAGVYLCRLEVNASGKKEVVFCKVAVVK
jgi:M6 family metalloprotease-like protein